MIFAEPKLTAEDREVLVLLQQLWADLRQGLRHRPRRWKGLLARNLRARAIQGSNSIEGYVVTQEDALAAVDGGAPEEAGDETWSAIAGYRDAMNYVLRLADADDVTFDGNLVRSLHFMMVRHDLKANPGTWRPGSIFVKRAETGEQVYEGPDRQAVPGLVRELCAYLNEGEQRSTELVVRAAMAHLTFVMIHPFSDGNGRMARCLQTLVLARGGVLEPTFSSIEEYLGRNTLPYYEVLAEVGQGRWSPRRTASPWIRFCLVAHFRQATTAKRRLDFIAIIGEAIEDELRRRGLPDRAAVSLSNAVVGYRIRNDSYRREADVSMAVASRDLKELADAGLIVPHGEKRGRFYRSGAWLDELARAHRSVKPVPSPYEVLEANRRRRQRDLFDG